MNEEAYVGSIFMWSSFELPINFAFCNGQFLYVSEYPLLHNLIGTTYGGNGVETFALPDLRSRVPIGAVMNSTPILTPVNLGNTSGNENAPLVSHTHNATVNSLSIEQYPSMFASFEQATQSNPTDGCNIAPLLTSDGGISPIVTPGFSFNASVPDTQIAGLEISAADSNSGEIIISPNGTATNGNYANMQPFLAINYIICLIGNFPSMPK